MGKGRAAVVLEWAEHRIGVDLVPDRGQKATAVIAAEIVAVRGDGASVVKDIRASGAGVQNGIAYLEHARDVDTSALRSRVTADRAICNATATKDGATIVGGNVLADSTIAYR